MSTSSTTMTTGLCWADQSSSPLVRTSPATSLQKAVASMELSSPIRPGVDERSTFGERRAKLLGPIHHTHPMLLDLVLPLECDGCGASGTRWCATCAHALPVHVDEPVVVTARLGPGVPALEALCCNDRTPSRLWRSSNSPRMRPNVVTATEFLGEG